MHEDQFQHFDPGWFRRIARLARSVGKWWFRYELRGLDTLPDGPCLVVGNHNGLGFVEEALMLGAWERVHGTDRRVWGLIHDWFLTAPLFASYYRAIGAVPASRGNAVSALNRGDVVLVFPGGDFDCCRPFYEPRRVRFGDRRGYARLAIETGVPIVPLATVGSHWTWTFLPGGAALARIPWVRQMFRTDRLPVPTALIALIAIAGVLSAAKLSLFWMIPAMIVAILPTPVRITTVVGQAIEPAVMNDEMHVCDGVESPADELHRRVHGELQRMVRTCGRSDAPALRPERSPTAGAVAGG